MPLSQSERASEIKRRAKAGMGEIPKTRVDEEIVSLETTNDAIYVISQYNIFRIRTADEIDPEVTVKDLPWTITPYLGIGSRHQLVASTFGMLKELSRIAIYKKERQDGIKSFLLEFALCAAELDYAQRTYGFEVKSISEKIDKKILEDGYVGATLQIPRVDSYEVCFGIFFGAAKRALVKLLDLFEWSVNYTPTHRTNLHKLVSRIRSNAGLKHMHEFCERVDSFSNATEFLVEIRNAYEHPSKDNYVTLENVQLIPGKGIMFPTWSLIHKKLDIPANQDFAVHMEQVIEMLTKLSEQILLLIAATEPNQLLNWQAVPRNEQDIEKNFPVRWKLEQLP